MNNQAGLGSTTTLQDPNNDGTRIPTYAIVILVIAIVIIIVIVMFLALWKYRLYEEKMARYRVRDNSLQDVINERRRLFSQ